MRVPFFEEVCYACNVLFVSLSLLSLYFFGGVWAGVSTWRSGVVSLVFQ